MVFLLQHKGRGALFLFLFFSQLHRIDDRGEMPSSMLFFTVQLQFHCINLQKGGATLGKR